MACRLLVENRNPLVAWTVEKISDIGEFANRQQPPVKGDNTNDNTTAYVRREQESCMVKATFDVKNLQRLRDLLHVLKINKLQHRRIVLNNKRNGVDKGASVPSKIREGLPEWVNYIPAKWYSSTIRQVFEYILMMYTLLTLTWAIWQLYKHVGFIRNILQPVLQVIEYYLEVLRYWFRWLDSVTDVFTNYWWMYMKPIILLATPLYTALASLFKPLRNIANVISAVTEPIVSFCRVVRATLSPLLQPLFAFWGIFKELLQRVISSFSLFWGVVARWSVVRIVLDKLQAMGVQNVFNELSNASIDPFKAQVLVIQNILLRSSKQILNGLKFIFLRIYYMFVFVKRERDYARENEAVTKDDGKSATAIEKEKAE